MSQKIPTDRGYHLSVLQQPGEGVGVMFLPGYRSEMISTKATALAEYCASQHIPLTRFDYFAHGETGGDFIDFTIGRALADALDVLDSLSGPQILIGSSMGGWLGLMAARERREQVVGFIGIAAAPDFTTGIMHERMTDAQREEIREKGLLWVHSDYAQNDYPMTLKFIEDGNEHALLEHPIPLNIPIELLQGQQDAEVKWETALHIAAQLDSAQVSVTLIKDGDHRLNRPEDLARMLQALERVRDVAMR